MIYFNKISFLIKPTNKLRRISIVIIHKIWLWRPLILKTINLIFHQIDNSKIYKYSFLKNFDINFCFYFLIFHHWLIISKQREKKKTTEWMTSCALRFPLLITLQKTLLLVNIGIKLNNQIKVCTKDSLFIEKLTIEKENSVHYLLFKPN